MSTVPKTPVQLSSSTDTTDAATCGDDGLAGLLSLLLSNTFGRKGRPVPGSDPEDGLPSYLPKVLLMNLTEWTVYRSYLETAHHLATCVP